MWTYEQVPCRSSINTVLWLPSSAKCIDDSVEEKCVETMDC